jgi:mannose-6-phosphate isomerase
MIAPFYRIGSMRVRRGYRGGALLEARAGRASVDGDRPEDWIASAVTAVNPGLPVENGEGLTPLTPCDGGSATTLAALLADAPRELLGEAHLARHGANLGFLAKLLDAAMRLHVQAHPTREFARTRMGAPYGKLEAYVILAVRPGCEGWIRLGFQHSPGRERWREIVATQDVAAMDACFEQIPVVPGEVWLVPGGWPHAIGPGVLMLEVMEPSDLVVRCEFEREGIVVPPAGRFMGRDLEFSLDVFDYTQRSVAEVQALGRLAAAPSTPNAGGRTTLIGPQHTSCFTVSRWQIPSGGRAELPAGSISIALVERGAVRLHHVASRASADLGRLDAWCVPAATNGVTCDSAGGASLLLIQPGGA